MSHHLINIKPGFLPQKRQINELPYYERANKYDIRSLVRDVTDRKFADWPPNYHKTCKTFPQYSHPVITARKQSLGQDNVGNVFTPVCHSVQGGGVHPSGQTPPAVQTPPPRETATEADGTHPTGMHSCSMNKSNLNEPVINDKKIKEIQFRNYLLRLC